MISEDIMAENTETDSLYMQMALELAREAKGKTFPNPAVGAVVVSQGGGYRQGRNTGLWRSTC